MQNAHGRLQNPTASITGTLACVLALCILHLALASAQQLLDKVVARIGTNAVTLSDVKAEIGLGLIDAKSEDDPDAVNQVVNRQLMLAEVTRFPPPEPVPAAVDQEVAAMKMRAGARLGELMNATGLDEMRLGDLARVTLRIQAYVAQRFGTSRPVSDEDVRRYYNEHQAEFTRDGKVRPFEDVEADARQRAAAARLRDAIAQWVRDLRSRTEVVMVGNKK
jgi:hypothetical protein